MNTTKTSNKVADTSARPDLPPNIVLVLQGGGALGAYQVGVYQALHEAGLRPNWVIGTSIGAINAGLIVGNPPEQRLEKLAEFWRRVEYGGLQGFASGLPGIGGQMATAMTMMRGLDAFFRPNFPAFASAQWPLGAENAGYYSTEPLRKTLSDLIDFDLINKGDCRLTVGAANVRTAMMHYFDSRETAFDVRHIMASGALPPAFAPVRIGADLYWDGGILSNTPVEAVFDDNPRRSALVFAVHVWNPNGPEPQTMQDVMHRQKDVQYSSRTHTHIARQKQLHKLRHIVAELAAQIPPEARDTPEVRAMAAYGCLTQMHMVQLLAPVMDGENHTKDVDFSPRGIRTRWEAGYAHTRDVVAKSPWTAPCDPSEGLVLHEALAGGVGPTV